MFRNSKSKRIKRMISYKLTKFGNISINPFQIHRVKVFLNRITIYTSKPGMIIGIAGNEITELTTYINENYSAIIMNDYGAKNFKIKIIDYYPLGIYT